MTTYYTQVPTLEMRVAASALIVIGKVGKGVSRQVDYYGNEPFVRTTYEVTVQQVLKGALEQKVIRVEVMGGESEKIATPLRAPMRENCSLLLILVRQVGTDVFVPYFGSAFPLKPKGRIVLGPQAAETLSSQVAPIKGGSIGLDRLRVVIKAVAKAQAAERKAAETMMAGHVLPPVLEMPLGSDGGGEPSAPQAGEQRKSRN